MDYKEMYLKMMRASEEAIRILIQAQQECEEMYVSAQEPELIVLRPDDEQKPWNKSKYNIQHEAAAGIVPTRPHFCYLVTLLLPFIEVSGFLLAHVHT